MDDPATHFFADSLHLDDALGISHLVAATFDVDISSEAASSTAGSTAAPSVYLLGNVEAIGHDITMAGVTAAQANPHNTRFQTAANAAEIGIAAQAATDLAAWSEDFFTGVDPQILLEAGRDPSSAFGEAETEVASSASSEGLAATLNSLSTSIRTSKSTSAGEGAAHPEEAHPQPPSKKRRSRKYSVASITGSTTAAAAADPCSAATPAPPIKAEHSDDDDKRAQFLERNRVAASKCREKKKHYVGDLEEAKGVLEHQYKTLTTKRNELVSEISGLKDLLLAHAKCGDPHIDQWLSNEARKFVSGSSPASITAGGGGSGSVRLGIGASEIYQMPMQPHDQSHDGEIRTDESASMPSSNSSLESLSVYRPGSFDSDSGARRYSVAYSHDSVLDTSPVDSAFPAALGGSVEPRPDAINYDHMADSLLGLDPRVLEGL